MGDDYLKIEDVVYVRVWNDQGTGEWFVDGVDRYGDQYTESCWSYDYECDAIAAVPEFLESNGLSPDTPFFPTRNRELPQIRSELDHLLKTTKDHGNPNYVPPYCLPEDCDHNGKNPCSRCCDCNDCSDIRREDRCTGVVNPNTGLLQHDGDTCPLHESE